ncbi:mitochondrial 54S ribosomal protein L40 [bacterium]|nr:mitochondrial 54S ribosomal protein L40 [bacterium]NDD84836.1 mitochondrial 54S ribosomal protein L40 [bacterium]NDG32039.1 mitochondrial 54S ribosomal protein L40 [bacterium]
MKAPFTHSQSVIITRGHYKGAGKEVERTKPRAEIALMIRGTVRNMYINPDDIQIVDDNVTVKAGEFKGYSGKLVRTIPEKVTVQLDSGSEVTIDTNNVFIKDLVMTGNVPFQVEQIIPFGYIGKRIGSNVSETISKDQVMYTEPGFQQSTNPPDYTDLHTDTNDTNEQVYVAPEDSMDTSTDNTSILSTESTESTVDDEPVYEASYGDQISSSMLPTSVDSVPGVQGIPVDHVWIKSKLDEIKNGINMQVSEMDYKFITACLVYLNLKFTRISYELPFDVYIQKILNPRSEFGGIIPPFQISLLVTSIFLEDLQDIGPLSIDEIDMIRIAMTKNDPQTIVAKILKRCLLALQIWLNIDIESLDTDQLRKLLSDMNQSIVVSTDLFRNQVFQTLYQRDLKILADRYRAGLAKKVNDPKTVDLIVKSFLNNSSPKGYDKYFKRFVKDRTTLRNNLQNLQLPQVDNLTSTLQRTSIN